MLDVIGKRVEGNRRQFGYYNPFFLPRYDFHAKTLVGAKPLGVIFQPLTSGEVGQFYWDYNSDGVWDEVTNHRTFHVFEEEGVFNVKSELHSNGYVFPSHSSATIEVTKGFSEPVTDRTFAELGNSDWTTAKTIHVNSQVPCVCNGYNFFRLRVHTAGYYKIALRPSANKNPKGLKLEVLSEIGFPVGFSGGTGEYGYMVVSLVEGYYYLKVTSKGYTEYLLTVDQDLDERPKTAFKGKVSLTGQNVITVADPYSDFDETQFLKIEKNGLEISIKLKVPELDKQADVYIVIAETPGRRLMYLTPDKSLSDKPTAFKMSVKSVEETELLHFLNIGNPLHKLSFYIAVFPAGVFDLNAKDYIIQVVKP